MNSRIDEDPRWRYNIYRFLFEVGLGSLILYVLIEKFFLSP